jgi:hypothetical protein
MEEQMMEQTMKQATNRTTETWNKHRTSDRKNNFWKEQGVNDGSIYVLML